jgi:hypothetical protein
VAAVAILFILRRLEVLLVHMWLAVVVLVVQTKLME